MMRVVAVSRMILAKTRYRKRTRKRTRTRLVVSVKKSSYLRKISAIAKERPKMMVCKSLSLTIKNKTPLVTSNLKIYKQKVLASRWSKMEIVLAL
jgi:hypothetical protein